MKSNKNSAIILFVGCALIIIAATIGRIYVVAKQHAYDAAKAELITTINQDVGAGKEIKLPPTDNPDVNQPIGGQTDEHGCLGPAGYLWCAAKNVCLRPWEEYCTAAPSAEAVFVCDGQKRISAKFFPTDDKFVGLELSDGRKLTAPHLISGSGARYGKDDGSFIFWNKGNTAFVTEGERTTFDNCVTVMP